MQTFALTSGKVRHGMFVVCLLIYKEQYNTLGWEFQYGYIQASDFWQIAKFWLVEFVTMTSAFGNYYTHRPALVKILLMLLCNCCAKIAPKKRTHNTNSTGMSVNLVVYACGFILIRSRKGQGSAYAAHQCSSWRWNLRQHRIIPALRLKHRSGGCGTASALPKCSIRHPVLSALLA